MLIVRLRRRGAYPFKFIAEHDVVGAISVLAGSVFVVEMLEHADQPGIVEVCGMVGFNGVASFIAFAFLARPAGDLGRGCSRNITKRRHPQFTKGGQGTHPQFAKGGQGTWRGAITEFWT